MDRQRDGVTDDIADVMKKTSQKIEEAIEILTEDEPPENSSTEKNGI
ncbi:hypothetical protein [Gallibacterium anatis]|nr:hypothetical protein [Gallibacterium anatis]WIM82810.1 hypothetical protein QP019_03940 [Gallibacterium anatis]